MLKILRKIKVRKKALCIITTVSVCNLNIVNKKHRKVQLRVAKSEALWYKYNGKIPRYNKDFTKRGIIMKSSLIKRISALFLAVLMLLTMVPAGVLAADELPMMKYHGSGSLDYRAYYDSIYSATFLNVLDWDDIIASVTVMYWDASEKGDESVITYIKLNDEQTQLAGESRYDLYIAGNGGVAANPQSKYIFYDFDVLEEVRGCENFDTSNATTFYGMFLDCPKLRSITSINWDTSNVTDMSYMFRNCESLEVLDLSSFNTSKVTAMKYMFYRCLKLEHIFIGDGWTTESVSNLNDG